MRYLHKMNNLNKNTNNLSNFKIRGVEYGKFFKITHVVGVPTFEMQKAKKIAKFSITNRNGWE